MTEEHAAKPMDGEVAVVTGGTRGIGKQVSLKLAQRGATVVATYYSDTEAAAATRNELEQCDTQTAVKQFDVGDYDAVQAAFDDVEDEFGTVTILINNAGMMSNSLLLRMSQDEWDQVIETNLTGTFNCTKAAFRGMMLNGRGRIVSVSSIAGVNGYVGQVNYAASKSGIIGFTRSLAREAGEFDDKDIRVNAVVPGYTETDILEDAKQDDEIDEDIPRDRLAEPAEIADGIVYLVSEEASYVHGEIHRIDGGLLS